MTITMELKTPNRGFTQHHAISAGFTLLELLIAMGVAMVLISGVFAGYQRFNSNERLRQAGASLKSNLRLAQSKAISGEKPQAGCGQLTGVAVTFSTSSYVIQAQCGATLAGPQIEVTLPSSLTISSTVSPLVFGVLDRGVATDVTITLTDGTKSFEVTVSQSGDINEVGIL